MSEETPIKYHLFISYSRKQGDWVRKLVTDLETKRGLVCFLDEWDLRPGAELRAAIRDAIVASRRVGIVISPDSMASQYVGLEKAMATLPDPAGRKRTLIPLYRVDCGSSLPRDIGILNYIDFRDDQRYEEKVEDLVLEVCDLPPKRRYDG